jgi:hypothetical protein
MNNNDNVEPKKIIEQLKNLTNRPSPRKAWKQGELLTELFTSKNYLFWLENYLPDKFNTQLFRQDYYEKLDNFHTFIEQELNLEFSKKQVEKYIDIYKTIDWKYIENNNSMLLEHLYTLVGVEPVMRIKVLDAMSSIEIEFKKQVQTKKTLKNLYRSEDIRRLIDSILNSPRDFSSEIIKNIILDDYISSRLKNSRSLIQKPPRVEKDINSVYFPELNNLHPKEPIDEQGLVAFFCTIFHLIKKMELDFKFPWSNKENTYSFSRIIYVRNPFPDARIEFLEQGKSECIRTLDIEFEYESKNYIEHKHHQESAHCHMIICWLNNWNSSMYYAPILSLKELLETGEIKLHYFD